MRSECAICGKTIPRSYFCKECYALWKKAIDSKEEWVEYLLSLEHKRRYFEKRYASQLIYLGDRLDITTEGRLVYRDSNG